MDTPIFEYIKNKRAVFEVRHYIIQQKPVQDKMGVSQFKGVRSSQDGFTSQRSMITEDDAEAMEKNDYIVLGYVKVPLL